MYISSLKLQEVGIEYLPLKSQQSLNSANRGIFLRMLLAVTKIFNGSHSSFLNLVTLGNALYFSFDWSLGFGMSKQFMRNPELKSLHKVRFGL